MAQTKKNTPENIFKSGTQSYRDLQKANEEAYKSASSSSPFANIKPNVSYTTPQDFIYEGYESSPLQQQGGDDYWGSSVFDDNTATEDQWRDLQETRAQNQWWISKAVSGIGKGLGLAATTFLDGTVGLATGIVQSMATGDWTHIWDNPVTQLLNEANEELEKVLPNYYTQSELENPWYKNIGTANFIFDKFIKNIGFTVGAAYSGGVYSKGIQGATTLIGRTMGAVKGLGKVAQGVGTLEKLSRYAAIGERAINMNNSIKGLKAVTGSIFSAIGEGTVEAVSNSNDMIKLQHTELEDKAALDKQDLLLQFQDNIAKGMSEKEALARLEKGSKDIDDAVQASKEKMEENRKKMGSAVLLANIPILTLDNFFMFGKMWAGGFSPARNSFNTVTRATKEAKRAAKEAWKSGDKSVMAELKEVLNRAKKEGYSSLSEAEKALIEEAPKSSFIGKLMAYTGGPLREANEEMAQGFAAEAAGQLYKPEGDYIYDAAIHPESAKALADYTSRFWGAVKGGFKETYGNINKWEEGFIGALTGAMGSPTFGKKANSTNQTWLGRNKAIGLSGGMVTEIRNYNAERKERLDVANHVNAILKDPKTVDRWRHAAAQISFTRDKNNSLRLNDKKGYKDAETAALFEEIMYLKKAGKTDMLKQMLESVDDISDEEVQELLEITQEKHSAYSKDANELYRSKQQLKNELDNAVAAQQEAWNNYSSAAQAGETEEVLQILKEKLEQADKRVSNINEKYEYAAGLVESHEEGLKTLSPYIHSDGTLFTEKEVREELEERSARASQMVDAISKAQDELDLATDEALSDEQLATLTYLKIARADWAERGKGILDGFYDLFADGEIFDTLIEDIEKDQERILEMLGDKAPKKLKEEWEDYLKYLRNIKANLGALFNPNVSDKEGASAFDLLASARKLKGDEYVLSDLLLESIEAYLEENPVITEDYKESKKKDLEDLKRILKSYAEAEETIQDYLRNPGKIDQAHSASMRRAENSSKKAFFKNLEDKIDFSNPESIRKAFSEHKSDIEDSGGMAKFLAGLPEDKRAAARKVLKDDDQIDLVLNAIGQSTDSDRKTRDLSARVVEEMGKRGLDLNDKDALDEVIADIAAQSIDEDNIDDELKRTAEAGSREEAIQEEIEKALERTSGILAELEDERERKLKESADRKTDEEPNLDTRADENLAEPDARAGTESLSEPAPPPSEEGGEEIGREGFSPKKEEVERDRPDNVGLKRQTRKPGYDRRRQLTEFYLFGKYGDTLADYYRRNPDKVPKGVDPEKFIEYVDRVTSFLKEKGAFTYISGINPEEKLSSGDKIIFEVEPTLTQELGTPIIVMKTESGQIVGTIRTKYEFDIYDESVRESGQKNTAVEAQRELYNAVISRNENGEEPISTTVESVLGGSLPVVDKDSSVAEVFKGSEKKPIIGLVIKPSGSNELIIDTGGKLTREQIVYPDELTTLKQGQVYVLIPTADGTYLPAMCYSTSCRELSAQDWYVQQALNLLMEMIQSNDSILARRQDFTKWLTLQDFHIDLTGYNPDAEEVKDKYPPVSSLEEAEKIRIKFMGTDGSPVLLTYSLHKKDGQRLSEEEIRRSMLSFILNTLDKQDLQTNIDKRRLTDQEYMDNMAEYLMVNLQKGIGGQHSMNDGFTYKPTDVETQYERSGKRFDNRPRQNTSRGVATTITVTYQGKEYTLDTGGTVRDSEGNIVDETTKQAILESRKPSQDKASPSAKTETSDSTESSKQDDSSAEQSQDTQRTETPSEDNQNKGEEKDEEQEEKQDEKDDKEKQEEKEKSEEKKEEKQEEKAEERPQEEKKQEEPEKEKEGEEEKKEKPKSPLKPISSFSDKSGSKKTARRVVTGKKKAPLIKPKNDEDEEKARVEQERLEQERIEREKREEEVRLRAEQESREREKRNKEAREAEGERKKREKEEEIRKIEQEIEQLGGEKAALDYIFQAKENKPGYHDYKALDFIKALNKHLSVKELQVLDILYYIETAEELSYVMMILKTVFEVGNLNGLDLLDRFLFPDRRDAEYLKFKGDKFKKGGRLSKRENFHYFIALNTDTKFRHRNATIPSLPSIFTRAKFPNIGQLKDYFNLTQVNIFKAFDPTGKLTTALTGKGISWKDFYALSLEDQLRIMQCL